MNHAARRVLERVLGVEWEYEMQDFGHRFCVIGRTAVENRAAHFEITDAMLDGLERASGVYMERFMRTPECAKAKDIILKALKENRNVMECQRERKEARREGGPGPAV